MFQSSQISKFLIYSTSFSVSEKEFIKRHSFLLLKHGRFATNRQTKWSQILNKLFPIHLSLRCWPTNQSHMIIIIFPIGANLRTSQTLSENERQREPKKALTCKTPSLCRYLLGRYIWRKLKRYIFLYYILLVGGVECNFIYLYIWYETIYIQ
jgi:hypothetical protein